MSSIIKLMLITCLAGALVISSVPLVVAKNKTPATAMLNGYNALKLFLEDEQRLTAIRRTEMVLTFSGISETAEKLIDSINDTSEQALDELEDLATIKPSINFQDFSDDSIAIATLDSMRMTTAKEFLFDSDNFEKNLLISQLKVLRVISHLAQQLEEKETSAKRKAWLHKLADQYEKYYQLIYKQVSISASSK